ncbi:Glycoside hydrolase family 76 protein [Mycena indigotica]|uniref:Glycoside hydrolase family 76 protein n=1 Tax=Mycena indigotica TaxID=2126181 RepID=A0A8H6S0U2_9AGAR|nr:Glycoside hydrolase family 76 protein [Mycena indigotica]KAF7290160.1 Glycoside hydrolase family 76 protein [Mycena indigotica]
MLSLPLPLLLVALVVVVAQVASQLLGASWRKPNITTSLEDRIRLAQGALSQAISQLDSATLAFPDPATTYGLSGALYSQLAEFDQLTNQSRYAITLGGYFGSAKAVTAANFSGPYVLNNGLNFGYGAVVAYKTYKTYNSSLFLQFAIEAWSAAVPYTITQAALDAGKMANKSFTLSPSCQGVSMAGGAFYSTDPVNTGVVVIATGGFFVLSALLAEATADAKYLSAAVQSMSFIRAHLYNGEGLVIDGMSASATDNCALSTLGLLPYNSGLMVEGLAVLYSISHNTTYRNMLDDLITASLATTGWQNVSAWRCACDEQARMAVMNI